MWLSRPFLPCSTYSAEADMFSGCCFGYSSCSSFQMSFSVSKNTPQWTFSIKTKLCLWILQNNSKNVCLRPETFPIVRHECYFEASRWSFRPRPHVTKHNDYNFKNRPKIHSNVSKHSYFSFLLLYTFSSPRFLIVLSNYTAFSVALGLESSFNRSVTTQCWLAFILVQTISDIWSMLHQFLVYVKHGCKLRLFSIIGEYIHEF